MAEGSALWTPPYWPRHRSKAPSEMSMQAQVNPREAAIAKWTRCQLSGQPLNPPCVSDELGHLFNKDAVVNALMEKTIPPALAHISRQAFSLTCLREHCALQHTYVLCAMLHVSLSRGLRNCLSFRSLRHLITLKLQRIRTGEEAARAAGAPVQDNAAQFCCPITGQEMNGRFPFVIMRHTGHVISRRALRAVSTRTASCAPRA